MARSQTTLTSPPFIDSVRPLFPYLHCAGKVATIPIGVVHAPPEPPFLGVPPSDFDPVGSRVEVYSERSTVAG